MKTSIFSLIIAIAIAILSLLQYEKYQNFRLETNKNVEQLAREVKSNLVELRHNLDTLATTERDIKTQTPPTPNWVLSEVDYLIHLANQKLQIERDVPTALALLTTAEERLQHVNTTTHFKPLLAALLYDQEALRALKLPDPEKFWLPLRTLIQTVPNFPLRAQGSQSPASVTALTKETVCPPSSSSSDPETAWEKALSVTVQELKNIIKIRHREKPIEPLLSTAEEVVVKERLQLMLEEICFAILNGNATVYKQMIQDTKQWIDRYFSEEDNQIKRLLALLNELSSTNLRPDLPHLTRSLEQINLARQTP